MHRLEVNDMTSQPLHHKGAGQQQWNINSFFNHQTLFLHGKYDADVCTCLQKLNNKLTYFLSQNPFSGWRLLLYYYYMVICLHDYNTETMNWQEFLLLYQTLISGWQEWHAACLLSWAFISSYHHHKTSMLPYSKGTASVTYTKLIQLS